MLIQCSKLGVVVRRMITWILVTEIVNRIWLVKLDMRHRMLKYNTTDKWTDQEKMVPLLSLDDYVSETSYHGVS